MTDHTHPNFRPDINGLRAWAVIAVVFFHFGVPGFDGGFIGVDIFFVISGFLMTRIVVKELERGTFSLLEFYLARARRILPALLVLCAVLLVLGWIALLPSDYKKLASHSVYALSFLSNIEFWQEAGYFDQASHEKWLLHTWSLAVEWQFYLVLPIILRAVWLIRSGRRAQSWVLGCWLMISLAASIYVTSTSPNTAFYLLHTRAWEMLAGGLVFLLADRPALTESRHQWLERAGLLLIVAAVIMLNKFTAWPSWRACLPVAAAMMVLLSNRRSAWTASWLPQWLGDRSYSLYLWHWPIVVALTYFALDKTPWAIAAGLLLATLAGHFSYLWIEKPTQKLLKTRRMNYAAGSIALASALIISPAVGIWKLDGVNGRFEPNIEFVANESKNFNTERERCHPNKGEVMPMCLHGGHSERVVVLGDSHANALISSVAAAGTSVNAGVSEWSYSGCSFVPGSKTISGVADKNFKCNEFNTWAESRLGALPSNIPVILINRYASPAMGENYGHNPFQKPRIFFSKIVERTTPDFLAEFTEHITQSACQLAKQRTVYMVRPIPEMGFNVPRALSIRMIFSQNDDLSIPIEEYRKRNDWVWLAQNAARDQCGIKILDPIPYLCSKDRCYGSRNGRPLYYDDDHMSEFGNKLLVPMFDQVFKELGGN